VTIERRIRIDPTNEDQLGAWDGDEGAFWAAHAERFDRSIAGFHSRFMEVAAITPADRVLDVGCGTGQTTRDAARAATGGTAVGVDLSADMLRVARRLAAAEGITNAEFEQADAQIHPFPTAGFDRIISRTATMFFGDRSAGFANLARSMRPGGRLTLLVWQGLARNEWLREIAGALTLGRGLPAPPPDAPSPFALADPAGHRDAAHRGRLPPGRARRRRGGHVVRQGCRRRL
jgi:SAM-dependent methyltransferase